ncbi:MAG: hypothetical protein IPP47_26525 [Bryobacterales bacterium]|nr:hypothetical protein [Bryobacterales bacterium]
MSYHATLFFSEPLVRQAAQAFWRRTVGIGFPFALAVMAAWLAALLWQGVTTWLVGALAMVLGFSVVILVLIYVVHYRNGLRKFREMGPPQASFQAEDASFTITSGLGSVTVRLVVNSRGLAVRPILAAAVFQGAVQHLAARGRSCRDADVYSTAGAGHWGQNRGLTAVALECRRLLLFERALQEVAEALAG